MLTYAKPIIFDVNGNTITITTNTMEEGLEGLFETVGEGSFGVVYRYHYTPGLHLIVKKELDRQGKHLEKPGWFREHAYTEGLLHPNIVRFYCRPFKYLNHYYGIMEDAGQSLSKAYSGQGKSHVPIGVLLEALKQISSAIQYLHRGVQEHSTKFKIHGDIRSPNVTQQNGIFKLIDFGLACEREFALNSGIESEINEMGNKNWFPPGNLKTKLAVL